MLYTLLVSLWFVLPIEYVMSNINRDHVDAEPTKVLIAKITKLKNVIENRLEALNNVAENRIIFKP